MADDAAGAVRRTPRPEPECVPPAGFDEWGLAKRLSYDLMAVDLGFHSESSEPVAHLIRHGWRPAGHTELELEAKLDAARINASDAERIADGLRAERDALQARIDAALALMDYWDEHGGSIPQGHRLRAALQGDRPADGTRDELTWRRLRMDEVLAEIDNYDGPTDPAELPEDGNGLNILGRIRALMHPAEPTGEADRG